MLFASKARHTQRSMLQACFFGFFQKAQSTLFWTFYIFQKKKNQNWIKTLGSWHYWHKLLICHIFSATYLSKIHTSLSVTCPRTHNPLVLLNFYFYLLLVFSPQNNYPHSLFFFFFFYFFPFWISTSYQLPYCYVFIFLGHSWKKGKKYDIIYLG